jgi:hypothetical protein
MRMWAVLVLSLAAPALADDDAVLGGSGESCRARLDCQGGLRCVNHVCVQSVVSRAESQPCQSTANCGDLRCVEGRCINPFAPPEAGPGRVRFFLGLVSMGGVAYGGVISNGGRFDTSAQSTFVAAVRAGVLIDERHEIAVELSPFTYAYYQPSPGPAFQVNATYGYRVPLVVSSSFSIYWPFRVGAGFFTGNTGGDVYAQFRADLIGVSLRLGHFMVDLYAPSFRYAISSVQQETPNVLSWEFGVGGSYVF